MKRKSSAAAVLFAVLACSGLAGRPSDAQNLVRNGGFEEGLREWECWHPQMLTEKRVALSRDAREGNNSIQFAGDPTYKNNHFLNLNQKHLRLKPATTYAVWFDVKPDNFAAKTARNVSVAVRELNDRGRTIKMHWIPVAPRQKGWVKVKRNVTTTGQRAKYYQIILYVRNLGAGEKLVFDNFRITERNEQADKAAARLLLENLKQAAAKRKQVTDRTYVFSRSQIKYGSGRNYLHWWIDRPLFHDRATRGPHGAPYQITDASFRKDIGLVKMYGMDGLSSLVVNLGQLTNYIRAADIAEKCQVKDFMIFPEYYGAGETTDRFFDFYSKALERALASRHAFRVKGKVVIPSYVGDGWTPEQLAGFLKRLRAKYGDTFLFVCDMRHGTPVYQFQSGKLTVDDINERRQRLRAYLEVCDGIMFAGTNHTKKYYADTRYGNSMNFDFLENCQNPLFAGAVAEERYRGKLLGLSAAVAYINHRSGSCKREDRTRALRRTFEIAMKARPDFIILPEWNEFNENTCFQPTVLRSFSTQRIIKYYTHQIKNEPPAPNPGDDVSLPNLIVSYRRVVRLGEALYIELLNVPDSRSGKTYTVQLTLNDIDGKEVRKFPVETFAVREMREKTYALATEDFATHRALVPALEIVNTEGKRIRFAEGLQYLRLDPTRTTNYLCVKQPLRDVCRNVRVSLKSDAKSRHGKRHVRFNAAVSATEKVASVELLENETEVYGYDRENEFGLNRNILIRLTFASYHAARFKGKVYIRNASTFYCRSAENDNLGTTDPGDKEVAFEVEPDGISINAQASRAARHLYITIPGKDVEKAVLELDITRGKLVVPVRKLHESKVFAKTFDRRYLVRLEHFTSLADVPVHVNSRKVAFTHTVRPEKCPIYHVRIITKAGKIFRSKPIMPFRPDRRRSVALNVFSATRNKVVPVKVGRDEITDLDYAFDPKHGDLVMPAAGSEWVGELGGGILYGGPFNRGASYPKGAVKSNPSWVVEDGGRCLKFDGLGNYINLPREALPRGSFTLSFAIKPTSGRNQVLFRNHGMLMGSLMVKTRDGRLYATYLHDWRKLHEFKTGLEVPTNRWSRIEVRYDLKTIVFKVNGKSSKAFPLTARPYYFQPSVFGGHTKPGYGVVPGDRFFEGFLKSLRIIHCVLD